MRRDSSLTYLPPPPSSDDMELPLTDLEKANQRALIAESMDRRRRRRQKERAEEKKQEIGVQWVVEMASFPGPPTVTWYDPEGIEIPLGEDMVSLKKANQRAMTAESMNRRRRRKQKKEQAEQKAEETKIISHHTLSQPPLSKTLLSGPSPYRGPL